MAQTAFLKHAEADKETLHVINKACVLFKLVGKNGIVLDIKDLTFPALVACESATHIR